MGGHGLARYAPFPAFLGWCDDYDPHVVDRYAEALAAAKAGVTREAVDRAITVATRYAAVDTGAIEGLYATTRGFTRTIAEQTATWQAALQQHGAHVERAINDALDGYDMVLDLVTGARPINESWIRQLHQVLCASQATYQVHTAVGVQQQPLPTGEYKTLPNNPTSAETGRTFHYAPVEDTPAEMSRLVEELRTPHFEAAHPVLQAAYAHYAFVRVHPFADGNGRVARAVASIFLYRRPGVPLVIFADQRDAYLDALDAADAGRAREFVSYVGERTIDTIEMVRLSLRSSPAPTSDESSARLSATLDALPPDPSRELELGWERVHARIVRTVTALIDSLSLPRDVQAHAMQLAEPSPQAPAGYRGRPPAFQAIMILVRPVRHDESVVLDVWVRATAGAEPAFRVTGHPGSPALELFARDVVPTVTTVGEYKIKNWCEQQVDLLVHDFERNVAARVAGGNADT